MTDRTPSGKFAPGNRAGKGRTPRPVADKFLARISGRIKLKDWDLIVDRAIALAQSGDWRARTWLAEYLIGKPPSVLDIRAGEAQLLSRVLAEMKERGIEPQTVLEAILAEIQLSEAEEEDEQE